MITDNISEFAGAINGETLLIIAFGVVFASFTACLFIAIFKTEYGLKKRAWFFIPVAFFCAVFKLWSATAGERDFSPLITAFGVILFIPLYFIREKHRKKPDERGVRELVRFIDGKMHANAEGIKEPTSATIKPPAEILQATTERKKESVDLDFSHVKSVIERLEPTALSYADRKQIHDLEVALYSAERGEVSAETKAKINEGLGNLLKIMAKHGA